MKDLFEHIHTFFNRQERFFFPLDLKKIKNISGGNGLYVMFEEGEVFEKYDRIVRIGSHDALGRLVGRIKDHFLSNRQRKSVLRKHIGRCLLNKSHNNYLYAWDKPFNKKEHQQRYKGIVDLEYEKSIEKLISEHISKKLSFCIIPKVILRKERDKIEEGLISILSSSNKKGASENWLGNFHPDCRIQNAKIWNIEYLNGLPLTLTEFEQLIVNKYSG